MESPDYDQIATDLEAAILKIASSGIRSYTIGGRMVTFNSPSELIKALREIQAAPSTARPTASVAEVI